MFTFVITSNGLAANTDVDKKNIRIEIKCYVELLGGSNTIHQAVISKKKEKAYIKSLVGKKIPVTGKKNQVKVHKVLECVDAEQSFTSYQAREFEKKRLW